MGDIISCPLSIELLAKEELLNCKPIGNPRLGSERVDVECPLGGRLGCRDEPVQSILRIAKYSLSQARMASGATPSRLQRRAVLLNFALDMADAGGASRWKSRRASSSSLAETALTAALVLQRDG